MANYKPVFEIEQAFGRSSIEAALSIGAAESAASKCGYDTPTICVNKNLYAIARRIGKQLAYNVRKDKTLSECEWYVEWRGKRYGSLGC
jgi:hypothetical protein